MKLALFEICKQQTKYDRYERTQFKINCTKRNCDHVIKYEPDFCLVYRPNKRNEQFTIFEIVESQDETETIADMISIKLVDNCRKAIFICEDESKKEMLDKVECVILTNLKEMLKEKSKKDVIDVSIMIIPKESKKEDIINALISELFPE